MEEHKPKKINILKKHILAGMLAILPLGLTLYILWFIFRLIASFFIPLITHVTILESVPYAAVILLSFVATLVVVWLTGVFATNIIGRRFLNILERLVARFPIINKIYDPIKRMTLIVLGPRHTYQHTVIIEFPRKGLFMLGFITYETESEDGKGEKIYAVFVPNSPNPTTGFTVFVRASSVKKADIPIEDAMQPILSGGLVGLEKYIRHVRDIILGWNNNE